ncbi:MAG: ABC transporter ATP-binding protein [Clostridia bacterium]|nr:ABC transporter ATP-binding protein [Clostridia bacterium]
MPELREPLLSVKDLVTRFVTEDGEVTAVDGVSFDVMPGETLGIVGESGSGKSVTSLSIMRLIPTPPGNIARGEVMFGGRDLLSLSNNEMRAIRGNDISMVFQEPMTSLNPVFTIGDQIMEAILLHQAVNQRTARERAIEMLRKVGIPSPERRVDQYPHQMSGGMRQRVMIAMAIACNPRLLIADEPTTALDVTIQAQILDLIRQLKADSGASVMLITHDLGVIAETADRVAVMYAAQIVESGDVETIFENPAHPYTRGLLQSVPVLTEDTDRLHSIEGVVPSPFDMPHGCRFAPRCPNADAGCRSEAPQLKAIAPGHEVRCIKARGEAAVR